MFRYLRGLITFGGRKKLQWLFTRFSCFVWTDDELLRNKVLL